MHDLKTFKCSNSSQKVRILLKKLGEIRKSSSCRGKFIQGTEKFVRPTEMFEFSSIRVIEIFLPEKGQQVQGTDKFVRPNEMFEFPSIRVIVCQLYIPFCNSTQPGSICLFEVSNGNIGTLREICSKLTIKTLKIFHNLYQCFYT